MSEITRILARVEAGDAAAAEELLPLAYDELRRVASWQMAREAPGQTLQPTALVHEAWLRLGAEEQPHWKNRAHFLAAAAEAMRRILVERARRKLRLKRGAGAGHVDVDDLPLAAPAPDEQVLQVHEALDALAAAEPELALVVKFRFFVGLSNVEIASLLGLNERTVRRRWELAKVRLVQLIQPQP